MAVKFSFFLPARRRVPRSDSEGGSVSKAGNFLETRALCLLAALLILCSTPLLLGAQTAKDTLSEPKVVKAGTPKIVKAGKPKPTPAGILYTFTNYSVKEGLAHSQVGAIYQDSRGNLWFGTWGGGVNKYDGETFTHFTTKEGLSHNDVWSILEDKSGNLWFGTDGGVNKYDGKTFTHFTTKEGLSHNSVMSILEDKTGNLWFGTYGGGVNKYDGETFTHYTTKEACPIASEHECIGGLSDNRVLSILEDKSGNLWFGTYDGGVNKYDGETFTHFTTKEACPITSEHECIGGLSHNRVSSILEDKTGNLWFGTYDGGVNKYDGETFTHFTTKEGLSHNRVWSILEDKAGNLWFGTYKGVNKYDPSATLRTGSETFTHFTTKEGLSDNIVWSILEDKSGNLWFGTYGGGVNKYDGETFTHFTTKEGLSDNEVTSLLEDKGGNIWVGTYGGGVCVLHDPSAALRTGGGQDSIKYKWTYINTENGLADNVVVSLVFDGEGYVWVGTKKGLSRVNPETFEVRSYGEIEGFTGIECNVNASLLDSKGFLWFGSRIQLTKCNPKADWRNELEPQTYVKGIKLFFEDVAWRPPSGPARAGRADAQEPSETSAQKELLEGIEFTGVSKWYPLPENLVLPYDKNHLTFEYVGISLKIPEKVRYQFMLEGLDKDWSPVTKKTEATYPNLEPGEYSFKVKACNDEGVWNKEPTVYSFSIQAPYWERWWFYLGQLLFFVLLIGGTLVVSRAGKNEAIITVLVIVCLFVIFEYIQNLCEPFYEQYVGSAPIIKTLLNLLLFGVLFPVQTLLRRFLVGRKKKHLHKKLEEV